VRLAGCYLGLAVRRFFTAWAGEEKLRDKKSGLANLVISFDALLHQVAHIQYISLPRGVVQRLHMGLVKDIGKRTLPFGHAGDDAAVDLFFFAISVIDVFKIGAFVRLIPKSRCKARFSKSRVLPDLCFCALHKIPPSKIPRHHRLGHPLTFRGNLLTRACHLFKGGFCNKSNYTKREKN